MGNNEVEVPKEGIPPINETIDVPVSSPNLAGAEPDESQPKQVGNNNGLTNSEILREDIEASTKPNQPEGETTPNPRTEATNVEGSSTDESCSLYIARKWQQLGETQETPSPQHVTVKAQKESESTLLQLAPNQEQVGLENQDSDSVSEVAFLDSPVFPTKSNLKSFYGPSRAKIQRLSLGICDPSENHPSAVRLTEGPSTSKRGLVSEGEPETSCPEDATFSRPGSRLDSGEGQESTGPAGSTVADALLAPAQTSQFRISDTGSVSSADFPGEATRTAQLSGSGRALIKEYFDAAPTFCLSPGHPVLVFNEGQVSNVLKVVADEAVRSSIKSMENLIHQVSRLNLGSSRQIPGGRATPRASLAGSQSEYASGVASDTSGALRSDDEFASIGYSYEHSDPESHPFTPPPAGPVGCSQDDPRSRDNLVHIDSPGTQTLACLKAEAVAEKTKTKSRKKLRKAPVTGVEGSRHRVARSSKIMKESYFKGMEWTKTFVSGPVDPRWNPYKFYCQICKGNISIYGRGAREILRHHATDRHLRKDQRWRYEFLSTEDPITKKVKHHVRGRDGKLLTPYELQLELPKFIDVPLVDIGEKLPFYDEYIQGTDYMASSSDNRVRIQVSVLGNHLKSYGDISTLRNFWRDIGVVVNHQSLFTDFDWSKERLSVSISV